MTKEQMRRLTQVVGLVGGSFFLISYASVFVAAILLAKW